MEYIDTILTFFIRGWNELLITILMLVAALLSFAVLKDKSIRETQLQSAGRRLVIAGQLIMGFRFAWLLYTVGDSFISPPATLAIILWGLGSVMCSVERIGRHWGHSAVIRIRNPEERRKQNEFPDIPL